MRSLAVLVSLAAVASAGPPTWPQWRGPTRDGLTPNAPAWPKSLDSLKVDWKVDDLGDSYSGPIVGPDKVFVTGTVDKTKEVVRALDRTTGKELWKSEWDGSLTVPFFAAKNGSWIRATPALADGVLYVAGIRDVLVALDADTGKQLWKVDFPQEVGSPPPAFGFVCSPLVVDLEEKKGVVVQAGGAVVMVDAKTGKTIWTAMKDGGGMFGSAFSSPVRTTFRDTDQLLVQARTKLAGLDPKTGDVLWAKEIPAFRGMNILTPQPVDGGVFTSTYGGKTQWFPIDTATDGLAPGDGWTLRYEGNMTSPVVVDGHAYLLGKDRRFLCVDLKTGEEKWRSDQRFGEYWSLVANGQQILALDGLGKLYLINADPKEFYVESEKDLNIGDTWAHLAVVGDRVFVRSRTGLVCYEWK